MGTEREKIEGARSEGGWLLPPYVDPSGQNRDSLGRGVSRGEIAAVAAADPAVQREREARWDYLHGTYRDPYAARAAIDEVVKSHGWTSAAARIGYDPSQFGELCGREGFFAGAKARADHQAAQRTARAVERSLKRIGELEANAEQRYRTSVETQRAADAVGIPRLSAAAERAVETLTAAKDQTHQSEAWRALQADALVAGELRAFRAAVVLRFGEDGVRSMLRAEGQAGLFTSPSIRPDQQAALDRVAGLTATLRAGERASESLAWRQTEHERQG